MIIKHFNRVIFNSIMIHDQRKTTKIEQLIFNHHRRQRFNHIDEKKKKESIMKKILKIKFGIRINHSLTRKYISIFIMVPLKTII